MKNKKNVMILILLSLLVLINFIFASEHTDLETAQILNNIKSADSRDTFSTFGNNIFQIKGDLSINEDIGLIEAEEPSNLVIFDKETGKEINNIKQMDKGSVLEYDEDGKIISGTIFIKSGEVRKIKINSKEWGDIHPPATIKIINGFPQFDLPKGQEISFESKKIISQGTPISFNEDESGNSIINSKKGFEFYKEGKFSRKINVQGLDGKNAKVIFNEKGDITKIENAKINFPEGISIESRNAKNIYYSRSMYSMSNNLRCIKEGSFACITDNEISIGGGGKIEIKGSESGYWNKKGEFILEPIGKSNAIAKIRTKFDEKTNNLIPSLDLQCENCIIQNGGLIIRQNNGEFLVTHSIRREENIPMEILSRDSDGRLGDTKIKINEGKNWEKSDITILDRTKDAIARLRYHRSIEAKTAPNQEEEIPLVKEEKPKEEIEEQEISHKKENQRRDPCGYFANIADKEKCYEALNEATNYPRH